MNTDEPAKTPTSETVHETTHPTTLHTNASPANNNTDHNPDEIETNPPTNLKPTAPENGRTITTPNADNQSSTRQPTNGANTSTDTPTT